MAHEEKRHKMERYIRLVHGNLFPPPAENRAAAKIREIIREARVELGVRHYSEEQIEALLDFYESDMGRSIVEADARIEEDFRERIARFNQEYDAHGIGGLEEIVKAEKPDGDEK